ncbi:MAG: response regulator [Mycobacteriales bacterium]
MPPSPAGPLVLVVDDDDDVRAMVTDLLEQEGFRTHDAADAPSALQAVEAIGPDVVLLDVTMPDMGGLDMLTELRRRNDVPVILLTGRGSETDRVVGLRMGADDYVVKPFSSAELVARVQSVLRRSRRPAAPDGAVLRFGRLNIDPDVREVLLDGDAVPMTAREFDLLLFLARSPRRVFSREQVLTHVWESSTRWQDPATVTEHVRRIRRKIETDPDKPRWLTTVRGVGYRFEP